MDNSMLMGNQYLTSQTAAAVDKQLMSSGAFSIDQLVSDACMQQVIG